MTTPSKKDSLLRDCKVRRRTAAALSDPGPTLEAREDAYQSSHNNVQMPSPQPGVVHACTETGWPFPGKSVVTEMVPDLRPTRQLQEKTTRMVGG